MGNDTEKPADEGRRSSEGLGLVEKLRSPWHHADCRAAADEIERLRSALQDIAEGEEMWTTAGLVAIAQDALRSNK